VDVCEFEGSSFPRLCQEIQHRHGEVGQQQHLVFQQKVYWKSMSFSYWKFMYFMLYLTFVKMSSSLSGMINGGSSREPHAALT